MVERPPKLSRWKLRASGDRTIVPQYWGFAAPGVVYPRTWPLVYLMVFETHGKPPPRGSFSCLSATGSLDFLGGCCPVHGENCMASGSALESVDCQLKVNPGLGGGHWQKSTSRPCRLRPRMGVGPSQLFEARGFHLPHARVLVLSGDSLSCHLFAFSANNEIIMRSLMGFKKGTKKNKGRNTSQELSSPLTLLLPLCTVCSA